MNRELLIEKWSLPVISYQFEGVWLRKWIDKEGKTHRFNNLPAIISIDLHYVIKMYYHHGKLIKEKKIIRKY